MSPPRQKKTPQAERAQVSEAAQMNLLRDIVHVVAGAHATEIVEILYKKENVNEFIIAKKLQMTINQARNILYRLSDEGMVHFTRKKDTKNGGWYTYFWTLDTEKSLQRLREKLSGHEGELKHELHKRTSERHYYSPGADIEYTEEQALEHNFVCPETGEVMELRDAGTRMKEIGSALSNLALKIVAVDTELVTIHSKADAVKQRRMTIENKKRDAEKAVKKEQAAAKRRATMKKKKDDAEKVSPSSARAKKPAKQSVRRSSVKSTNPRKKSTKRTVTHKKTKRTPSGRRK